MMSLRVPDAGMSASQVFQSEQLNFENGGADIYQYSNAYHMEYSFEYGLYEAAGSGGLNNYAAFASGYYGTPIVYFADPMFYDVNLFPPNFSAPALAEQGWKSIGHKLPVTYSNTVSNTVSQPLRTATIDVSTLASGTLPQASGYSNFILPVPPGMTAWVGVSGSATGTGAVRIESWLNGASSPAASSYATLISPTSTTRLNTSVSGSSANYLRIGVSSTGSGSGTISITSMMIQLWPTGVTPVTTGSFQLGEGNNGCKFSSDAREEKYVLRDDQGRNVHYMGLSFGLVEVIR